MKYSYHWLQRHIAEPLPAAKDLIENIIFHAFEVESFDELTAGDSKDWILDIKVLPDRAADCLSHAGMAREIAGLLNLTFVPAPLVEIPSIPLGAVTVDIQSPLCDRYCAIQIDGVRVGPSPEWLKQSLESIGQKSINNIVDVTNLVLFDSGQPTHAFDAAKIVGGIIVRKAKPQETIVTLSGEEKQLGEQDLVIADTEGLLALAGIKGGKKAEVTTDTTSIILEIAHFDATSVRKSARRLSVLTDAAKRFENNLSVETVADAAKQLVGLMLKVAGGEVKGISDYYPTPLSERKIKFSTEDITRLLGDTITADSITGVLNRYQYIYSIENNQYELTVPHWRPDLTAVCNVAEEIGRVYGYEHIPAKTLPFTPATEDNAIDSAIQKAKQYLVSQGYSEVMNYTFRKKGDMYVAYGTKDKSALRTNLTDGLKESYDMNRLNAPLLGLQEVKLFEVGTVFTTTGEAIHIATADKKSIEEYTLDDFAQKIEKDFTPSNVSPLSGPIKPFTPWSVFPFVVRDIAVWLSREEDKKVVQDIVEDFCSHYCVRQPVLFDTFTKDGKVSVAYRLVFQSLEKTLTDEEVEKDMKSLIDSLNQHERINIR